MKHFNIQHMEICFNTKMIGLNEKKITDVLGTIGLLESVRSSGILPVAFYRFANNLTQVLTTS